MTERPMKCAECQNQPKVLYKEIINGEVTCLRMCNSCPVLEEKLQGYVETASEKEKKEHDAKLSCANCLTTLEAIKTGNPLGCSNCYAVFGDLLIDELLLGEKHMGSSYIHIGKSPEKTFLESPSFKLSSLHEALEEALKKENYEEAASLRDQIKDLTG